MPDFFVKFVTENIFLIAIAFVSGAMLVWPLVRRGTGGPSVNTLEATMLINKKDSLVLDVRAADEFSQGHILNARNIPLDELESAPEGDRAVQGEAGHRLLRRRQPGGFGRQRCCASRASRTS